jgi:hypothetical protein
LLFDQTQYWALACLAALLVGCTSPTVTVTANADPSRTVLIHRLAIVARTGELTDAPSDVETRLATMLGLCGILSVVDTRRIDPQLPSSLVEPSAGVQADAVLVVDALEDPFNPRGPLTYEARLRRAGGPTIWRAKAVSNPGFGFVRVGPGTAFAAALANRMVSDHVLPDGCRQPAA